MGGIFSKPKVPTPPSPEEQAKAQQVSQFTPFGNLLFGTVGPDGTFQASTGGSASQVTQTPFQQELQALGELLSLDLGGQLTSQFGESGLVPLTTDFAEQASQVGDTIFEAGVERLQPGFDLQRSRLEQQLADQGVPLNSDAYDDAINRLETQQNEQLNLLSLDAQAAAGAEQNRLSQLASSQRAQQFSELGALLGFQPSFQPMNVQGIDLNANFASQLAASQANQAAQAQQAQNIAGFGQSLGFLLSDRKEKENIVLVGEENGYNLYEFNYKGSRKRYVGVMADEVEKVTPEAVMETHGTKLVNYGMIGVTFREAA